MSENLPDFSYLGKHIMGLKTALFRPDTEIAFLPNNIISTLKVDERGHIWFFTSCQKNVTPDYDAFFYSSLEYFNKERTARINVSGRARLVSRSEMDWAQLADESVPPSVAERQILLIDFAIEKAECYNLGVGTDDSWLEKMKVGFQNWLNSNNDEKKKFTFTLTK